MSSYSFFVAASAIEILLGFCLLFLLVRSRELQTFWPLLYLAMWQTLPFSVWMFFRSYGRPHHIPVRIAYNVYFYTYWCCYALEAVCAITLTYTILHGAMAPLQGLQKLVKIVYFWAAAISLVVAANVAFVPSSSTLQLIQQLVLELQKATGIITVSLAIFVCIAIRPMGLSLKSRVFGTSLGLIIVYITNILIANFTKSSPSLYDLRWLVQIGLNCVAEVAWIYYFAVPEPKRKFILLATTSPFHRWNQIAEQFGQDPGVVAIGGIPPEAFASAEMEVFHRASAKMKERELAGGAPTLPEPSNR